MTSNNWGGTRQGAGRHKAESPKKTVVVRADESLLQIIKILKQRHQAGEDIETLLTVTSSQTKKPESSREVELEKLQQVNIHLVLQRDKERLKTIFLESDTQRLTSDLKAANKVLSDLKHKIYDCQALKINGERCTRSGKLKTRYKGIEINTCLQHSNIK